MNILEFIGFNFTDSHNILKHDDFVIICNSIPFIKGQPSLMPDINVPTDFIVLPRPEHLSWSVESVCSMENPYKKEGMASTLESIKGISQYPIPSQNQRPRTLNLSFMVPANSLYSKYNKVERFLNSNLFEENPKTFEIWFVKGIKNIKKIPYFRIEKVGIDRSPFHLLDYKNVYRLEIDFKQSFAINEKTVKLLGDF